MLMQRQDIGNYSTPKSSSIKSRVTAALWSRTTSETHPPYTILMPFHSARKLYGTLEIKGGSPE